MSRGGPVTVHAGDIISDTTHPVSALAAVGTWMVVTPNAEVEAWATLARDARRAGSPVPAPPYWTGEMARRGLQFAPEGGGWDDVVASLQAPAVGAAAPTLTVLPGMTTVQAWAFAGTGGATDRVAGAFEFLHGYKEGTDVFPHFHLASDAVGGGGTARLVFAYAVAPFDAECLAEVSVNLDITPVPGLGANGRAIVKAYEPATISGTGRKVGDTIRFTVTRTAGNPADTYTGNIYLLDAGLHYQSDTRGSAQKFTK